MSKPRIGLFVILGAAALAVAILAATSPGRRSNPTPSTFGAFTELYGFPQSIIHHGRLDHDEFDADFIVAIYTDVAAVFVPRLDEATMPPSAGYIKTMVARTYSPDAPTASSDILDSFRSWDLATFVIDGRNTEDSTGRVILRSYPRSTSIPNLVRVTRFDRQ